MRTWLLTLVALPFALLCGFLVLAIFKPADANFRLANHRSMHLHADSFSVELISSRELQEGDPISDDFDRDWTIAHVRRSTFLMPFGANVLFTMYVMTMPHLVMLLLSAVLPVLAILQLRQARLRRLNPHEALFSATAAEAPMPPPSPESSSEPRRSDSI